MKKNIVLLLMAGLSLLTFYGCNNDESNPAPTNPTSITSIAPNSGPRHTLVFIKGENFGESGSAWKVFFNDVEGTVLAATDTMITCRTPASAETGMVTLEKDGKIISGPMFNYLTGARVTTFSGTSNVAGFANGTVLDARFGYPARLVADPAGNLFITDRENHRIRKITPEGVVTTFAGNENPGTINGNGVNATFQGPYGIAIDENENLYIGEFIGNIIRKITSNGDVITLAGSGDPDYLDGTGTNARFFQPVGIVVGTGGDLYVADYVNNCIRKCTWNGVVTTFAGTTTAGLVNGTGAAAAFNGPFDIVFDASDNMIVADYNNHAIRKVTPAGVVTTLAGSGAPGFVNGTGTAASFNFPAGLLIDPTGNIYVCDTQNHSIRKITPAGVVTTLVGLGTPGSADGGFAFATFNSPTGLSGDFTNNVIYVTDFGNHRIRKITLD